MSNLEHDLIASGYTPVPLGPTGIVDWTGWRAPPDGRHVGYCTVCRCSRWECNGPEDVGDLDPDVTACAHWDEEAGEADCYVE